MDTLIENKVKKIYITGFLTEYCINATALDSLSYGFETFIINDCVGTADENKDKILIILNNFISLKGKIIDKDNFLELFK